MAVWRVRHGEEIRLAVGDPLSGPDRLLPTSRRIDQLLSNGEGFTSYREDVGETPTFELEILVPLEHQEVWAAGVTFQESRFAREDESTKPDFYRDVYFADRPELFFKASPGTVVGPGEPIGVRVDSKWSVPEPEVGLLVNADGRIVGLTVGNDVSSRSIEGENPLYLPQAKVYDLSCAVGPCIVPLDEVEAISSLIVELSIEREGSRVFAGSSPLADLKREPEEIARWLFKARTFPVGVLLLCGTGIVPGDGFNLASGDVVTIRVDGVGVLENRVRVVGRNE